MKILLCLLFLGMVFYSGQSGAQSQKAMVINNGALVYVNPDFDSELLTELKAGAVYDISLKTKGPFYKIRVRPKITGWIADTDVKVGKFKGGVPGGKSAGGSGKVKSPGKANSKDAANEEAAKPSKFLVKKKRRPFDETRFRGPTASYVAYTEDTMGAQRTQNMPFFGFKVEGPNTLFSGDMRTSSEFLFHPGAPDFYEKATGTAANGWIFLTDFVFETALPQSASHMLTFGFGPMFKYTHYEVTLQEAGHPLSYSLDDMAVGAVFDLGLGFRLGSYALRFNGKYYWEKTRYWALGLTFGFPF
jgi:hypothetical protein